MNYNYSLEHVTQLRSVALQRNLYAPADFWSTPNEQLRICYNGIGPEAWSPVLRSAVTLCLDVFESDALIHDYEYEHAPRTYSAFTKANLRFACNAIMNAFYCTNLTAGFRHVVLGVFLALLCQLFGWHGFRNVKEKNILKSKELQ